MVIFTFCNIHIVKTVLKIEAMYRATYMLGRVTNCLFFAFVICEPSTRASENSTDSSEGSSGYEFLNIGGLFSIHGQNGTSRCGAFRIGGFEELNAMLFAVNKVNENNSLLPGIKLLAKIEDTCSSVELAAEKSLNFTVVNYQSIYECNSGQSSQGKPMLAIVGGRSSDISRAVTSLVGLFHIPVISYGATSTSLSGVKYFTRTVAPATFATQALIDVVRRFGWNYVILLYSNNEYGQFAAGAFRQRLRKNKKTICIAVDEQITEDANGNLETWKKIYKQKYKTKVVVIFATYDDFMGFLHSGNDLDQYIWLSDDMWNGQASNLTRMIKYAISVIPRQVYVSEFANFFHNTAKDLNYSKRYSVFDDNWFEEYHLISEPQVFRNISSNDTESSCVSWGSSEVSYVMDAVYTIAWALHGILCNDTTNSCDKSEGMSFIKRKLLKAIKGVNFENPWTKNNVSFTRNGNPRNVKFSVVSLQQNENCFLDVGHWSCSVDVDESCEGNLTMSLKDVNTASTTENFLGVCGTPCPAGQYKIVDKDFASCCWECMNCTGNTFSRKPGSSVCKRCKYDEWPTVNRTACAKVKPQIILFTEHPFAIILLCVNVVSIKIVITLVILVIKYSQSNMKIFLHRILCYLLLFGILVCNIVAIFVLTNGHKQNCLLTVILAKLGSTCTLGTIFVKTNDVYRTYKKKILKNDPRYLSQEGLKVMLVVCLVIVDIALLWFSINNEGENRNNSRTIYFSTETGNTGYVHCGFIIDIISREIFTVLELSFYWGLLLICTHQSYLTRKVTDKAHGLRYVFFGSLALSVNSITMLLTHSFTDNRGDTKELVYSFYHTFFATVALACTFIPKIEILVFHPEKDALYDAFRTTNITNPNSMIRMNERRNSDTQSPGQSGTQPRSRNI